MYTRKTKARRNWTPEEDKVLINRLKDCRGKYQITRDFYMHTRAGQLIEDSIRNHQMDRNRPRYERQEQQRLPKPMDED